MKTYLGGSQACCINRLMLSGIIHMSVITFTWETFIDIKKENL